MKKPSQIAEEYLLSVPGLTVNDRHMIEEYLYFRPNGQVRAEKLGDRLRSLLRPYLEKVDSWAQEFPYGLAQQVQVASLPLAELACPLEEVWLPSGWTGGLINIRGLRINTWDRPTIRVVSESRWGRFTDAPFDFGAFSKIGPPDTRSVLERVLEEGTSRYGAPSKNEKHPELTFLVWEVPGELTEIRIRNSDEKVNWYTIKNNFGSGNEGWSVYNPAMIWKKVL